MIENSPTAPIRVVIVDDHAVVRQGVRAFLETQADVFVQGEAGSGEAALALCEREPPDVVLMDLVLPDMDGAEATRRLKAYAPQTQVIILTSFLDEERLLPAVRSGALSYLLKDVGADELLRAIRAAARGEAVFHNRVTSLLIHTLRQEPRTSAPTSLQNDISDRETEVLCLIAEGLSNADIARKLFISEKTVKSHVSNILAKLNISDRTQAAVYAWRHGLVKSETPRS